MKHEGAPQQHEIEQTQEQSSVEPEDALFSVKAYKAWKAERSAQETEPDTPEEAETEPETQTEIDTGTEIDTDTTPDSIPESTPTPEDAPESTPTPEDTPLIFTPEMRQQRKLERESYAKRDAQNIADLNRDFINTRVSVKDFPFWEDDFKRTWDILQSDIRSAGATSMEDEARLEEAAFFTKEPKVLHETIEAQSGYFYRERARTLKQAIEASDLSEADKRSQLDKLDNFWLNVVDHLHFKNMTPEEVQNYGEDYCDRARTRKHNQVITNLNELNDLANSYGLTPFTPRNFWTSRNQKETEAVARRMRYDRDLVEEFYAIAFEREIADDEEEAQDRFRGYLYF